MLEGCPSESLKKSLTVGNYEVLRLNQLIGCQEQGWDPKEEIKPEVRCVK